MAANSSLLSNHSAVPASIAPMAPLAPESPYDLTHMPTTAPMAPKTVCRKHPQYSIRAPPTMNILYKYNESTVLEFLWIPQKYNKEHTILLVHGFIRNTILKKTMIPLEINDIIFKYALFCVTKYEINIHKGHLNKIVHFKETDESKPYKIKYIENMSSENIAFCDLDIEAVFDSEIVTDPGIRARMQWDQYNTHGQQDWCIRTRAILTDKIITQYSEWTNFQTRSKYAPVACSARSYVGVNYRVLYAEFWEQYIHMHKDKNANIRLENWLSIWKNENIKLSEHNLQRIYYFLTRGDNESVSQYALGRFVIPDPYRSLHGTGFTCNEWRGLRSSMSGCVFGRFSAEDRKRSWEMRRRSRQIKLRKQYQISNKTSSK